MANLTGAEKLDVQKAVEAEYENSIASYRKWSEASKNGPAHDSTDRMLDREAEEVAKKESLMAQFGEVPTDKLTLAERVDIEGRLRKSEDRFVTMFRDGQSVAGVEIAKAEALYKGFNAVSQRKPVPPFAGCR